MNELLIDIIDRSSVAPWTFYHTSVISNNSSCSINDWVQIVFLCYWKDSMEDGTSKIPKSTAQFFLNSQNFVENWILYFQCVALTQNAISNYFNWWHKLLKQLEEMLLYLTSLKFVARVKSEGWIDKSQKSFVWNNSC